MKGLNKAYLIGHIGQDPDLRTTASGTQLVKLSVATPSSRKVNGEWVDTHDWHRVTFFGQQAEFVSKYAHKGDVIAVECTIRPNKWTDRENVVRYEVSLLADRVLWLNNKHRGMTQAPPQRVEAPPAEELAPEAPPMQLVDAEGEEAPF